MNKSPPTGFSMPPQRGQMDRSPLMYKYKIIPPTRVLSAASKMPLISILFKSRLTCFVSKSQQIASSNWINSTAGQREVCIFDQLLHQSQDKR